MILDINTDPDSDSDSNSVLPSSSISSYYSSLPHFQPCHCWSSTSLPWSLLRPLPLSPLAPCLPTTSSFPYCWICFLRRLYPKNWIQTKSWRRNFLPPLLFLIILFFCGLISPPPPHPPHMIPGTI